jgi:hypothetical protein
VAGTITGTRGSAANCTRIVITLNSSFNFDNVAEVVKVHPMSCGTNQPYVSPGEFTAKTATIVGKTATVTGPANTACYGIHVDVVHAR